MNGDPFDPFLSRELTPILTSSEPEPQAHSLSQIDVSALVYHIQVLQKRVQDLEAQRQPDARLEALLTRCEEFMTSAEYKFEKIQAQFHKQHELYKAHFRDLQSKIAVATGWMKERHKADSNLEETLEEQNQIIQGFEARMQQWQKIMSDKELQMLTDESDKNRIEKMQAHLQRQYESVQKTFREMQMAIKTLSANGGRSHEESVNDLVERQRQMMQQFELRLQQSQKIMSDQELQLMNSRAELKETLKELAKLRAR